MKYVLYSELKEPYEENMKKMYEIEKGRQAKGETFSQGDEYIDQYMFLEGNKGFLMVDTDDVSKIIKWTQAYSLVAKNIKIIPVLNRKEWEETMK